MKFNYKNINIGSLLKERVEELQIPVSRICSFLKLSEGQVLQTYQSPNIEIQTLLKWCKLLEYDFFRVYSQHLILYAPRAATSCKSDKSANSLPSFRKNIYTVEIKEFIIKLVQEKKLSPKEITKIYGIPKTTLHRWINK